MWERFDRSVRTLNRAITGSDSAAVADAFGELSDAAAALAEAVAQEDAESRARPVGTSHKREKGPPREADLRRPS